MKTHPSHAATPHVANRQLIEETEVVALYRALLDAWNRRDPRAFALLFLPDGHTTGFDGSPVDGRAQIEAELEEVFVHHRTATYIGIVRRVLPLGADAAVLFAVAGMVPYGESDIDPAVNAMQSMVAAREEGQLLIASFQNTPAAFHGRPEMAEKLTSELRAALRARPK